MYPFEAAILTPSRNEIFLVSWFLGLVHNVIIRNSYVSRTGIGRLRYVTTITKPPQRNIRCDLTDRVVNELRDLIRASIEKLMSPQPQLDEGERFLDRIKIWRVRGEVNESGAFRACQETELLKSTEAHTTFVLNQPPYLLIVMNRTIVHHNDAPLGRVRVQFWDL